MLLLYVSYGSNMNLEQMAYRCPNSKVIKNGKLIGWKLVFNYHADIIETKDKNDFVPVVIWDVGKEDFEYLDIYEGYPTYYVKEEVEVVAEDGDVVNAIVYVMADDQKGFDIPTRSYFECIESGYIENGIDVKYLYEALYDTMTVIERCDVIE